MKTIIKIALPISLLNSFGYFCTYLPAYFQSSFNSAIDFASAWGPLLIIVCAGFFIYCKNIIVSYKTSVVIGIVSFFLTAFFFQLIQIVQWLSYGMSVIALLVPDYDTFVEFSYSLFPNSFGLYITSTAFYFMGSWILMLFYMTLLSTVLYCSSRVRFIFKMK